jgi:anthranilate phosphoribosyltransferase
MDVCGTGGDGKDTFNISTTSAFVVAGAGQAVAKHGNHGVSSAVGSSTVLEYLGVKFTNDADFLRKKMETAGICYLHAPLFHPAMKYVAPIRKELGIRTFFNILGPILNPAMVKKQFTGVSDMTTFDLYKNLFLKSGARFGVVHSIDIYDEISLTSPFLLATGEDAKTFEAKDLGFEPVLQEQLHGGAGLEDSAKIMLDILQNKGTQAQTQAVLANAAVALSIGKSVNIENGIALSKESLESGKAYSSFKKLVE